MRKTRKDCLLSYVAVFCYLLLSSAFIAAQSTADVLVLNGRIYTVNAKQPWAEALAIRQGKIIAVGTSKDLARFRGTSTKVIDAQGHLVLPGFTDCHVHFMGGSL